MSCNNARNHERALPPIFQVSGFQVTPLGAHPDSIAQIHFNFTIAGLCWIVELTPAQALQMVSDVGRVYQTTAKPLEEGGA